MPLMGVVLMRARLQGQCCAGLLDQSGACCSSGNIDECGICEGDGSTCAATIVIQVTAFACFCATVRYLTITTVVELRMADLAALRYSMMLTGLPRRYATQT